MQVLTNLVDNAKDSMGTKGGDIVLRAWYKEQVVYISVTDSGTGISQEVKRKLFVSMYTSKGAKGTGLGLYSSAGLFGENSAERCGWKTIRPAVLYFS